MVTVKNQLWTNNIWRYRTSYTLTDLCGLGCVCVRAHACRWAHFCPLSADWSIVIGLSVSSLFLSFVLWTFCGQTLDQKRKEDREEKEKEERRGETERKWRMFASRQAWLTPSTKSPDIYSALLTNLKKSSSLSVSLLFSFHSHSTVEGCSMCMCRFLESGCCRVILKRCDNREKREITC